MEGQSGAALGTQRGAGACCRVSPPPIVVALHALLMQWLTSGQQALDHGCMLHHPLVVQLQAAAAGFAARLALLARRGAAGRGRHRERRSAVLHACVLNA